MESACNMPTDAADDWITPVNNAPNSTLSMGFLKAVIRFEKPSISARGETAFFISSIPNISTAKPTMIVPIS